MTWFSAHESFLTEMKGFFTVCRSSCLWTAAQDDHLKTVEHLTVKGADKIINTNSRMCVHVMLRLQLASDSQSAALQLGSDAQTPAEQRCVEKHQEMTCMFINFVNDAVTQCPAPE